MMKVFNMLLFVVYLTAGSLLATADTLDLAGTWRFASDPDDKGIGRQWYQSELPGQDTLYLPGSLQEQGFGEAPGPTTPWTGDIRQEEWEKPKYDPYRSADNFKMPFWLQPERYYKGAAWYQKTVTIPDSWRGKHVTLTLERPHWETCVWVGSRAAGSARYLSAAHTYDLSKHLTPGEHMLTVRVDNRMIVNVGPNSHSVSDHTQSNWNGIVGKIELKAEPATRIENVQVYPDPEQKAIRVVASLASGGGEETRGEFFYEVFFKGRKVGAHQASGIQLTSSGMVHEALFSLEGPIRMWDEFNPDLYTLTVRLETEAGIHERMTTFGMRRIELDGNRILLNGRRIFLRGTLECCIFPKTGYPPTNVEAWRRIINICKSHGLNHIRFHSWCPPEAAFIAADELGFYYQVECSSWANQGASVGNGTPLDAWLYEEADAILKAYGNHPSFLLFAYGNEPAGPGGQGGAYLDPWVAHYKKQDDRRLVTGGSGWPMIEENEFHVTSDPRIQQWGQELRSRINSGAPETVTDYGEYVRRYPDQAIISHEIGQWCVYPNFDEISKYTGVLKPKNFEVFQDFLRQKGMLDQARDFLMASGKLQTLCYKEDIESALRTPGFGGFQLLDLHDFPGQGTALVGVLDPFWDSKPYVTPGEYSRFCNAIVPLARLPKRLFTVSDTLRAQVDVSQFGPENLTDVQVRWSLVDREGNSLKSGVLNKDSMPTGELCTAGTIDVLLSGLPAPAKYRLVVSVEGTDAENDWDVWVYPDTVESTAGSEVMVSTALDDAVLAKLREGGKVLLSIRPEQVKTDVKIGFSSIFWNTAWTGGQAPHTLGVLCDPDHPALAEFPTEYHSNWQWSQLIQLAAAMNLDEMPGQLKPIVQVVPDWFEPKRLGLIFEAELEGGSLLICSINLLDTIDEQPAARQLRHSLLQYMTSENFKPKTEVKADQICALFRSPPLMERLGARVIGVDSFESGYDGANAIDGDPATLWHTQWSGERPAPPHEIQIVLARPTALKGITYLPRQDGNPNGKVKEYAVYVSNRLGQWGNPVAHGIFESGSAQQTVTFSDSTKGQFIRFISNGGFGEDPFTSIAELNLMIEE